MTPPSNRQRTTPSYPRSITCARDGSVPLVLVASGLVPRTGVPGFGAVQVINFPRVACGDVRKRTVCKIFLDRTPRKHGINTSSAVIESARRGPATTVVLALDASGVRTAARARKCPSDGTQQPNAACRPQRAHGTVLCGHRVRHAPPRTCRAPARTADRARAPRAPTVE